MNLKLHRTLTNSGQRILTLDEVNQIELYAFEVLILLRNKKLSTQASQLARTRLKRYAQILEQNLTLLKPKQMKKAG
jgi:hypothetical protein